MRTDPIPRTMQAVVYRGVNDLRVETVPVPRCGAHEVLVKVAACGVCPTDIKKIQHGTVPVPRATDGYLQEREELRAQAVADLKSKGLDVNEDG